MEETVIKLSGNMKEIEIDQVSDSDDLEDLDATDEDEKVTYQVWLLGRDENDDVTDFEYCIDEYELVEEAIKCWKFFAENDIKIIKNKDDEFFIPADVKSVDLVIEEVATDEDGNEECFNIVEETNIKV